MHSILFVHQNKGETFIHLYYFWVNCFLFNIVLMLKRELLLADLSDGHTKHKQATIGARVEVCSRMDSSGKVNVHFNVHFKISHPITLNSETIGISGPWNCPWATRLGPFVSISAQATHSLFGCIFICLYKKRLCCSKAHSLPSCGNMYVNHTPFHKPNIRLAVKTFPPITKSSHFAFPPCWYICNSCCWINRCSGLKLDAYFVATCSSCNSGDLIT